MRWRRAEDELTRRAKSRGEHIHYVCTLRTEDTAHWTDSIQMCDGAFMAVHVLWVEYDASF